jgi:hypothetical protein
MIKKRSKRKPKSGCQPVGQSAAFEKVNGFFRIATFERRLQCLATTYSSNA